MTSHGTRQGFALRNQPVLTPERLNSVLELGCGEQPTVVLVSSCYSGIFTEGVMRKPNRVILSAAREDRTSFGCSVENDFTYWDGCLIDNVPKTDNWESLYGLVQRCVQDKESRGRFAPSLPQAFFGDKVANLKLPGFSPASPTTNASNVSRCPVSMDPAYGFTVTSAVKVGNDEASGPEREGKYLKALRGPQGQALRSSRIGSVLASGTILHIFELSYEGLEKPVAVFLDIYHFEAPKAPSGFSCGVDTGL
jgi:hypothetical protein